jgi:hypothetical protein
MEIDESENSSSVNQWIAINKFLYIYKGIGIGLLIVVILLTVTCINLINKNPIVILAGENESTYFQGRYTKQKTTEADLKLFAEKFVTRYYEWNELEPEQIIKNVAPLITDDLKETMLSQLKQRKEKDFLGKKIKQSVAGISVQVTKGEVITTFDIVLRVEGIPLIVPTQLTLLLAKGVKTEWNPMGLYVNTVSVREGK